MKPLLGLLVCLLALFMSVEAVRKAVSGTGKHVCPIYYTTSESYSTSCWSITSWFSCTKYRSVSQVKYECCDGWETPDGVKCDLAVCDGKTNPRAACHRNVAGGLIVKPDGSNVTFSAGRCYLPQKCQNCSKGFWAKNGGPYCEVCPQIANCDFEECGYAPKEYKICARCNGYYGMNEGKSCNDDETQKHGCSAFNTNTNKTQCMELCSWRPNSTACWPGSCGTKGHKTDCRCHPWFRGPECMTITKPPNILHVGIKLDKHLGGDNYRNLMQNNPNEVNKNRVFWTNADVTHADLKATAEWKANPRLNPHPKYVSKPKTDLGIVKASATLISRRANGVARTSNYPLCGGKSFVEIPEGSIPVNCNAWEVLGGRTLKHVIEHGASLYFEVVYTAGGFITTINLDRDQNNRKTRNNYIETSSTYKTTFMWDLVKPYSLLVPEHFRASTEKAKQESQSITVTWKGWRDDNSQLHPNVTVGVQRLDTVGKELSDPCGGKETVVPITKGSRTFTVQSSGVYSVILTVSDIAGNYERSSRFFTYDPGSKLQILGGTHANFSSAAANTSYQWQHDLDKQVVYRFDKNHFINPNHTHGSWLGAIRPCHGFNDRYDDNDRLRTRAAIRNNQGVVKMEIGYLQYRSLTRPNSQVPYKSIDIFSTSVPFTITRKDADTIEMFIRVTDYMDRNFVENKTLRIDSTNPIIANLWLTREGKKGLAVHNSTELRTMTFECEAYDPDTGIKIVEWTIFDNHTSHQNVIYHANQFIGNQGTKTLAACKNEYFDAPYGPDCYSTIYHGSFHRDFRVTPGIGKNNGLHPQRKEALHDVDIFINVTVINWANLITTLIKKVTIDTSQPMPGIVHDGLPGDRDQDFQSSKVLAAHWEGFFDHESGVVYYQYHWGTSCKNSSTFGVNYDSSKVKKTDKTSARWTAPGSGTYHITVVAFNAALDHSAPVCSNGVTVDDTGPVFGGLTVDRAVTKPGLVKQNGKVYHVGKDRRKSEIKSPSTGCLSKATATTDITTYSDAIFSNDTLKTGSSKFCEQQQPLSLTAVTPLTTDSFISANWTAVDGESGIASYELGLMTNKGSKDAPDILPYTNTGLGSLGHFKAYHPGLTEGKMFYIGIRATNKASLMNTKLVGPFVVEVTPPTFSGKISTNAKDGELVATWNRQSFVDGESADPFTYAFAVGTTKEGHNGGKEVAPWTPLAQGAGCTVTTPPTCTLVHMESLKRRLHPGDTYFISIKATNFVGLSVVATSDAVKHFADPPAKGMVLDVAPSNERIDVSFGRADDIDYQTSKTSLEVAWYGFGIAYHATQYRAAVGTTPGGVDVSGWKSVTGSVYKFEGLRLQAFKTYYTTIWATNVYGEVKVISDGVKVIDEGASVDAKVFDGPRPCKETTCTKDIDYQVSQSSLSAHWSIPSHMTSYVTNTFWKVEQQNDVIDSTSWKTFEPFLDLRMAHHITKGNMGLASGKRYTSVVKFCQGSVCFKEVRSNGFLVQAKPPAAGSLSVEYQEPKSIKVVFSRFVDVDIPELYADLSRSVVDVYQWAVTANSQPGQHIEGWTNAGVTVTADKKKGEFTAVLPHSLAFKECYRLALRGTSKSGLSTTVFKEIKPCAATKPYEPTVIDALGQPVIDKATNKPVPHKGHPIVKKQNEAWPTPDQDYTPYTNILSATWPSLRHRKYTYAVIADGTLNAFSHYNRPDKMAYKDPCSLPTAIKCGKTESEYVNIEFPAGILKHGKRYYICLHADAVDRPHEKWKEQLAEVNRCSDGITVDITPPKPGEVWVGPGKGEAYLTSHTEMYINWSGFVDVEEHGKAPHKSGIRFYECGIGSQPGFTDIVDFKNVGMTGHALIHGLHLQDGHTYYATVRATDYVNLTSAAMSLGVTIDTTPPMKTNASMKTHHTSRVVFASWDGVFYDQETPIADYEWSVGSQSGYADVMPYTRTTQTSATSADYLDLQNGHTYYISVKAFNKAGLSTLATAWPVLYDPSPPVKGYVFDGRRDQATADRKDLNYQRDNDHIWAYWEGFRDPHSGIVSYSWSVGTCAGCGDLLQDHPLGTITDAVASKLEVGLRQCVTYYVTITACNGVGMCTSASSDGVTMDSTPPIGGLVHDGVDRLDREFQNSRDYVGAKWWGFLDPQSGISHYSWWIGTTSGGNDLMKEERLHHAEMAYMLKLPGGVRLPVGKTIYTTVRATNHVGLSTAATSNGFKVVTAAPKVVQAATHIGTSGSVYKNTQVYGTVFGVTWKFDHADVPVESLHIRLYADGYNRKDMPTIRIGSTINRYFFTNVTLHDGTWYYASVTACNFAKLCTTSASEKVLADNSPPLTGMFAIDTEHAAELSREEAGHYTWSANSLSFSVLGFFDLHSGIKYYDITAGTTFGGWDIMKKKVLRFSHGTSPWSRKDEGLIQKFILKGGNITSNLKTGMNVYISVVGINWVGLESALLQRRFKLLSGGGLALVRRCRHEYCEGHCTCSPHEARCSRSTTNCPANKTSAVLKLNVYDILDVRETAIHAAPTVTHSPSTCVLAVRWKVDPSSSVTPIGYDYAVGFTSETNPTGLTSKNNVVWQYVGLRDHAIHTRGQHDDYLVEGAKYSLFIRAWTSPNEYKIFKSAGVIPAFRPPSLSTKQAATVKDCRNQDPKKGTLQVKDVDVYNRTDYFCVSWRNAFQDRNAEIWDKFFVSIGSSPGIDDILKFQPVAATSFSVEFTKLKLIPKRRYFSNVRACNKAGLCSMRSSDGVLIDTEKPLAGMVMDGTALHDEKYQNRTTLVAAHWNGFDDVGSSINHYAWCVGTTPANNECGVRAWANVGLHTRVRRLLKNPLTPGRKIYNKVYALDAAGYKSSVAVSDGVLVDTTPPSILTKLKFGDNLVNNPYFGASPGVKMDVLNSFTSAAASRVPTGWKAKDSPVVTPVAEAGLAKQGGQFLYLYGTIYQTLTGLVVGARYIVTFYASHIQPSHSPSSTQDGKISLPDDNKYVFRLRNRTHRHDVIKNTTQTSWVKQIFFFTALSTSGDVTISSVGARNGIAIDCVSVKLVQDGAASPGHSYMHTDFKSPMHVYGVFTEDWNTLHLAWEFEDKESPIVEYKLAIGTQKGDSRLYGFKSHGLNTFAQVTDLQLTHNSRVFVTVIARNAAGLSRYLLSDPIKIDMTPPVIEYVWDGDGKADISFQDSSTVKAQWSVVDPESGVQYCEYGIGTMEGSLDIKPFSRVPYGVTNISHAMTQSQTPARVYTIVRCHNYAGGVTTKASNGVGLARSKPSTKNAWVRILTGSTTVYPNQFASDGTYHQSLTNDMFLHWGGFEDPNGIIGYEVKVLNIDKKGPVWDQWITIPGTMTYMRVYSLGLTDDAPYEVTVCAKNVVGKRSGKVTTRVTINGKSPRAKNGVTPKLYWRVPDKTFTMDWSSVFQKDDVASYEVSLGTVQGGADIKQWQEMTSSNITFDLEDKFQQIQSLYATITAANHAGLYSTYKHTVQRSEIKSSP